MSVVGASSTFQDRFNEFGPDEALTSISSTNTGYWHSAERDCNPTITFEMQEEQEVLLVEVVDRLDCCHDRFKEVEVRVGNSLSFEEATSCGIQSYEGETTYK